MHLDDFNGMRLNAQDFLAAERSSLGLFPQPLRMDPSRDRPKPEDVAARRSAPFSLHNRLVLSNSAAVPVKQPKIESGSPSSVIRPKKSVGFRPTLEPLQTVAAPLSKSASRSVPEPGSVDEFIRMLILLWSTSLSLNRTNESWPNIYRIRVLQHD